ncbi:hypothetical protein ATANTOWER_004959 [Ataeniobius toweri]|uniref:Uncharacterized protein n=1 Tax=Ataeniobius toweri TaxID=208326 RepID=A0ABU7A4F0_9TELE|nr:hypothetical protein [Ataeniobius toweri]
MHNFISSGFVTLGRGHLKAQQSIDESGQMSWQGDLDIPISYEAVSSKRRSCQLLLSLMSRFNMEPLATTLTSLKHLLA